MKVVVAILSTGDDKYYLMLSRDGDGFSIMGWPTAQAGLDYFNRGYRHAHSRGWEPSMSACINFIQFRPAIVEFDSLEDLERQLLPPKLTDSPTDEEAKAALLATPNADATARRAMSISSVSGHYHVLPLVPELARPIYDVGQTPSLV